MSLKDKVIFISGASRGIGLAIALRAARDGSKIVVAAKTTTPHPKLPGTIYTAAEEVERAGGKAFPLVCDIRDEESVKSAIEKTVERFASAISLTNTQDTTLKKYNLMHEINARGTWLYALPHLIESGKNGRNPHVLNISPPLSLREEWFSGHVAYSMAKFNMSLSILGWAGEFRSHGIAANALWPLTVIDTAALNVIDMMASSRARKPDIMVVLRENGQKKFDHYAAIPGNEDIQEDYFIEPEIFEKMKSLWKKGKTSNSKL
ncbi:8508_t:CDS:10 [Entrophospora sp. SA101]|nr:10245_t:CDS:10 [Entrophospora sp. SA101]CAJ0755959.1 8508_t:CDS:10 [Entrophospora sp. SA101]CAJ0843582.1 14335_t:CDS:10 [Entrophospora sp. SA101]CAJ0912111.1 8598_t:CDS:10 [Entrophospora sp. SA101]